ncbi:SDR family oxidoreductase [Tumebacillus sp. DT12]|uniref:SDR family oxidoreductase n=1 Tax=Tumebacillus lacus TaxID=2995335 RepID=A0ABT3X0Q2_9BACL|nr:SDR family oxidoreductase [Tumebacillus lacus]MCX7569347.1 SDR family oxidoreductase [Tumebacillus lacus]
MTTEKNPAQPQKQTLPPQTQHRRPGIQSEMKPLPETIHPGYQAAGKLTDKVALITGGDSGIGRAVAVLYAKEGADVAIAYLCEDDDAAETQRLVEAEGRDCLLLRGDIGQEAHCKQIIDETLQTFGRLDILVNNAAEQHPQKSIADITSEQFERTFRTNIFSFFYLTRAALPHLKPGSAVINTASVTAYHGHKELLDYSSTKGAVVTFTRSLALQLVEQGIRVNAVAPGPIWTPLIPSTFTAEQVAQFGTTTPMKRAGQPSEVAPAYVYLAAADSTYMTGQVLHVNGGEIVNG